MLWSKDTNDCYSCVDVVKAYNAHKPVAWMPNIASFDQCKIKVSERLGAPKTAADEIKNNIQKSSATNNLKTCAEIVPEYLKNNPSESYSKIDLSKFDQCKLSVKGIDSRNQGCYGAKGGECFTCADVIKAYQNNGWDWKVGINDMDQCKVTEASLKSLKEAQEKKDKNKKDGSSGSSGPGGAPSTAESSKASTPLLS